MSLASRARRVLWELRTEGEGATREAVAVGLGVFIGSSPLFGLHLLICIVAGWCLRLNRLKMYVAANISNPVTAPLLLLAEVQAGAWIRRGELHALTLDAVRTAGPWTFGIDLVVGSVVVGLVLGLVAGLLTFALTRSGGDPWFEALTRRAADRYASSSLVAWEFARGKLRADPVYRAVLVEAGVPSGGTLVDVGCGQGLMLALLAEAAAAHRAGTWPPAMPPPPVFDALVGIETRRRAAAIARGALGADASIVAADAREHVPPAARVVLFFDVLHMIPEADQERLLDAAARALAPGGAMLVREPDAAAGWRFLSVRAGNTAKAIVTGNWSQRFHFRTATAWRDALAARGLDVAILDTATGTPFANVLFVTRRADQSSPS